MLGVSSDATIEEIHRAFRRLLREHHPDTRPDRGATDPDSDQALQRILTSYEMLRGRRAGPTQSQPLRSHPPSRTHPTPLRATPVRWLPTPGPAPQRSEVPTQTFDSLMRWLRQM